MILKKIVKIICVVIFTLTPVLTLAQVKTKEPAYLYIEATAVNVAPKSEIIARLLIDSKQPVNAFDITLGYQKQLLEPAVFNDSSSIINIWKNRMLDVDNGIIRLSGGMVKPFSGNGGVIAEFKFTAKSEGEAKILFSASNVYYADGTGAKAEVITKPLEIAISQNAPLLSVEETNDTTPPVFEFVKTAKNPADNNYFVVFQVKDAESGVKSVYLRQMKWFAFDAWRTVNNPIELSRGTWLYQISAGDNNGNTFVKTSYVAYEIAKKLLIGILLLFLAGFLYVIIRKWVLLKK